MKIQLPMPSEKQKEFIKDSHKFLAYGGSRGGGKSFGIREKCIVYATTYPKSKQLVLRRTYPELYNNHINPMKDLLFGAVKYNDSQKMFTFPNGSTISYGYCDNDNDVRRYQGQEVDVLYIDEATQFPEEWFTKLTACVRGTNDFPKSIVVTCNPGGVGHQWVKRLFIDRKFTSKEKPENYRFIQSSVYDNKALLHDNPDYLEQLEALPDSLRKAWLEGRWDVFEGSYFSEWTDNPEHYDDERFTHVINPFDIPNHWKIYRAYDHGYAKPFACLYFATDTDGCAYEILEYYGWTGEANVGIKWNTDTIFSKMKELESQHPLLKGKQIIGVADPAIWQTQTGESVADTAARYGIFFAKGDNARINGWMQVRNRLHFDKNGKCNLYIFKNCENTIRTFPLMQYDENIPEDMDSDLEDHCMDAIRYFCMTRPMKALVPEVDDGFNNSPLHTIFKFNREDFR